MNPVSIPQRNMCQKIASTQKVMKYLMIGAGSLLDLYDMDIHPVLPAK